MKAPPKTSEAIRQLAQVERDGAAFFHRANRLAADPRVKFIFGRAAEEYENALKALEPFAKGRGTPKAPAIFPFADYADVECYVCGFEVEGDDIPEVCPSCGAARYAFEKEVSQDRAWELVARTTKGVLAFAKKAGAGLKDPKGKEALAKALAVHRGLLGEAQEERARLEGAAS